MPASFVEELNAEPTTDLAGSQPEPATQQAGVAAVPDAQQPQSDEPVVDGTGDEADGDLLDQVAKAEGLDLNDPTQRAWAEKFAAKEKELRDLKASGEQPTEEQQLTEFEKQLLKKPGEAQPKQDPQQQGQPQQQAQQPGPPRYNDIGDTWKNWNDAHMAEAQAWNRLSEAKEAGREPDFTELNQIQHAKFVRMADNILVPAIRASLPGLVRQEAQRLIQEQIGDVIPQMRDSATERMESIARDAAIKDLEGTKGFEKVRELFKAGEGTIKYQDPRTGQWSTVPATPLNRIMAANPEILNIQVDHEDPATSYRATYISRLRAAMRIHRQGQVSPTQARDIMAAGRRIEQNKATDRTRQALNAGGAAPKNNGRTGGTLVDDLQSIPGSGESFAKLF